MVVDRTSKPMWRVARVAIAAGLLLVLTVILQNHAGAFDAEFSNDDSSHVVSGLLLHDYLTRGLLASGGPASPIGFLTSFHSHYPLVGIGHWGPLYYAVEAGWMLAFGTTRSALLLLSAVVTVTVPRSLDSSWHAEMATVLAWQPPPRLSFPGSSRRPAQR
ncbi:hypothetical protein [Rhodopila sp.]|uniref:hypothetical protein n=1 Tax=Rhodopila sp. TaxID=2480087 RepID=UPI003D0C60ED